MSTLSKNIVVSIMLALSLGAISSTVGAGQDSNQRMLIQQTIATLQAKQKAQAEATGCRGEEIGREQKTVGTNST